MDEVNRKQREYRRAHVAHRPSKSITSPEQSAKNWRAYREQQAVGPTAEQAALGWLDLRKGHASPDQAAASSPLGAARDQPDAFETSGEGASHDSPARGHDFGL